MTGAMQWQHWVIILVVVLLLFGTARLPGLAKSVGQSMKIFKKEIKDLREEKPEGGNADNSAANDSANNSANNPVNNSADSSETGSGNGGTAGTTTGSTTGSGSTTSSASDKGGDAPKA